MDKKIKVLYKALSFPSERRKPMLTTFLFLFLIFWSSSLFAQNRVIKGLIVDEQQSPVVGATVVLKSNSTIGVAADLNGEFSISVPAGDQTLVVSFIGMEKQEVKSLGTNQFVRMGRCSAMGWSV